MARLRISEFALIYGTSRQQLGQLLERSKINPAVLEDPDTFHAELLAKASSGKFRRELAKPEVREQIKTNLKRWLD